MSSVPQRDERCPHCGAEVNPLLDIHCPECEWRINASPERIDELQSWEDKETTTGERFLQSAGTGQWYRVTEWIELDDGKYTPVEVEELSDGTLPGSNRGTD